MIVTLENLKAGIDWWKQANWGMDIINSEYRGIYDARDDGITRTWWDASVKRLWDWKAIRARKPPNTKEAIKDAGLARLDRIALQIQHIRSTVPSEPGIEDVEWEDIAELFGLSFEIKCGNRRSGSPVFACKMCHFIFPKIFPVIDNLATGVFDYEFYWRGMRGEWLRFPDKERAKLQLKESIICSENATEGIHDLYPWETKIIELSHIGYAHS